MRPGLARAFLAIALAQSAAGHAMQPDARVAPGSGSFIYPFFNAGTSRDIKVWYHRPAGAGSDAPVVFVIHGAGRTGENYRKYWIPFAEERHYLLLVPEFSRAQFSEYSLDHPVKPDGTRVPRGQLIYSSIEGIFDAVRGANALSLPTYDIYGHSGGGQFVHRLVLLLPEARYRVAVAANAGWYTMPDAGVTYPYGLAGADVPPAQLARALARNVVVILGDQDIDPKHPQLRNTPEAVAQGVHRYARGHAFFEQAARAAKQMNTPFAWRLQSAPGVAHSNARMAPHAAVFVGGP